MNWLPLFREVDLGARSLLVLETSAIIHWQFLYFCCCIFLSSHRFLANFSYFLSKLRWLYLLLWVGCCFLTDRNIFLIVIIWFYQVPMPAEKNIVYVLLFLFVVIFFLAIFLLYIFSDFSNAYHCNIRKLLAITVLWIIKRVIVVMKFEHWDRQWVNPISGYSMTRFYFLMISWKGGRQTV